MVKMIEFSKNQKSEMFEKRSQFKKNLAIKQDMRTLKQDSPYVSPSQIPCSIMGTEAALESMTYRRSFFLFHDKYKWICSVSLKSLKPVNLY